MKKPTLKDALTPKPRAVIAADPPPAPPQEAKLERLTDRRINTTLRLEPELLEELKIAAARERVRVNDLLLEGVRHVLALRRASRKESAA
jgi:hypothetical protein